MNSLEVIDKQQTTYDNYSRLKSCRFRYCGIATRLFITCWMVFVLHFATNIVREIYPAITLGDHLSFNVSEYVGLHPDIFEIQNGKAYINNNPGASILGAVPYAIMRPLIDFIVTKVQKIRADNPDSIHSEYKTGLHPNSKKFYEEAVRRGLDIKLGLASGVIQAFCMAPLSALTVLVMFYILVAIGNSPRLSIILSLLFAFATPVFYRTAFLNHNILLGHFSLFSFALLWRPWDKIKYPGALSYFIAGILCGWTIVLDYSGIVAVISISFYAVLRYHSSPMNSKSFRHLVLFFLGIALCGCLLISYQWIAFGHPLYPAQHYMPPTEFSQSGYNGITWPKMHLLFQTAFNGRYGLFTSAPILLLIFFLPFFSQDLFRQIGGIQILFILVYICGFFLFCASNQFGYVQYNTGVRHIVPVIPFLFLLITVIIKRIPKMAAILFSIISLYWSWCLAMYRDVEFGSGVLEPLINITFKGFQLPWLTTLNRMGYLDGKATVIPLFCLCGTVILCIWVVKSPFKRISSDA